MYGAILGDMVGSPYEFDENNIKTKDFPLFSERSRFTDDSILTLAVADAFLTAGRNASDEAIRAALVSSFRRLCGLYPDVGYGPRFLGWLAMEDPKPYGSLGNGSAMRVSPVAWLYDSLDAVLHAARLSAEVTHNHPEGIKGAQATAAAIFLARSGSGKAEIRRYIEESFGYDLSRSCDEIRPGYHHIATCAETVPQALAAFLEGQNFEDVLRTAVSLGGDSDTLTAIAGSVAEGYYGVPEALKTVCRARLTPPLADILRRFEAEIDFLRGNAAVSG